MSKVESDNIVLIFCTIAFCVLTVISKEAFGLKSEGTILCIVMTSITMISLILNIIINSKDLRD